MTLFCFNKYWEVKKWEEQYDIYLQQLAYRFYGMSEISIHENFNAKSKT